MSVDELSSCAGQRGAEIVFDLACDYANVARGLVAPVARRSRELAHAGVHTSGKVAFTTSLRLTSMVSRPIRAVIR